MKQQEQKRKPLSLYPLKFDEALVALAKTKPEPKVQKPKSRRKVAKQK
jgi:hypothetical protein